MTIQTLHLVIDTTKLRQRIVKTYGSPAYNTIEHLTLSQIRDVLIELIVEQKLNDILGDIRSYEIAPMNSIPHCRKSLIFATTFPKFPVAITKIMPRNSFNMLKIKYPNNFHQSSGETYYLEIGS